MSGHTDSQASDRTATTPGDGESTAMRIDQAPGDPSSPPVYGPFAPGGKDLVSTPAEKRAAANAIEQHLEPDTKQAGGWAQEETSAAVKALAAKDGHGWITSRALKNAHKSWSDQVRNLMNRLGAEKSALRDTHTILSNTDLSVDGRIRSTSPFDSYH
ncbi:MULTISPECIES: hypothetical protein [unclassified Streptomyces]|uniref:hypothetical protein n=1 Tax=unclassified Streptomyces TaxID=2593676 RepID=UPI0033974612